MVWGGLGTPTGSLLKSRAAGDVNAVAEAPAGKATSAPAIAASIETRTVVRCM